MPSGVYNLADEVEKEFEEEDTANLVGFICQRRGCTEGELLEKVYIYIREETLLFDIPRQSADKKKALPPEVPEFTILPEADLPF